MPIDRRTLLKHLGLGAAMTASGMSFYPKARAQARPTTRPGQPINDRYYVFCLFEGGWDILLSLDPRDPRVFTPQAARATGILPAYDMLRTEPNGNGVYLPNRLALAGSHQRAAVGGYLGDLLLPQNINDICIRAMCSLYEICEGLR